MGKRTLFAAAFGLATAVFWGTMLMAPPTSKAALSSASPDSRCLAASDDVTSRLSAEQQRSQSGPLAGNGTDEAPLSAARRTVAGVKKATLLVLGTAMQRYGEELADEQEVLMLTADLVIEAFGAESTLLRAEQARRDGARHADVHEAIACTAVADAALRADMIAREAVAALTDGDARRVTASALRRLLKSAPVDTVALRRTIAAHVLASGGAGFDVR